MPNALTRSEVYFYQATITSLADFVRYLDVELIERYLEQTRLQADGTLDAIIPHFMSITDMREAQMKMKFLRAMGAKILEIHELIDAELDRTIQSAHGGSSKS